MRALLFAKRRQARRRGCQQVRIKAPGPPRLPRPFYRRREMVCIFVANICDSKVHVTRDTRPKKKSPRLIKVEAL